MFNSGYNNNMYYRLWDAYWRSYRINSEVAIQIALQQVPGQVIKVELDYENGILFMKLTYVLHQVYMKFMLMRSPGRY